MQVGRGPGNNTLVVRTVNAGLTLLAVWDSGNAGVADYIPIPVGHAIHLDGADETHGLVVGDVVCFNGLLTGPDGEKSLTSSKVLVSDFLILHFSLKIV